MANTLLTPEVIAKEALAILTSNMVYKDLVHTDYSKEFVNKIGDTVNIRKPASFAAKDFAGSISKQDATESNIPVSLNKHKDVSVALSPKDYTLNLVDFSKQIMEPAMIALAEQVDQDIANYIFEKAGNTVTRTKTNPTDLKDITNVAKVLDAGRAPKQNRHFVLSTEHNYAYALVDNLLAVNYAGDNQTLRDSDLGRLFRMQTFLDQNNPLSTAAISGTATGTFKVETSATENEVKITELSAATATVKTGDGFVYNGTLYRFTEDGTGSTSAITSIAVTPAFPSNVDTAVEVYMVRNSASLSFHKDAFTFVNRPLAIPQGAVKAAIASANGLSVRVVYGYDQTTKEDIVSFDILYGVKDLRPELATRLVDGALS